MFHTYATSLNQLADAVGITVINEAIFLRNNPVSAFTGTGGRKLCTDHYPRKSEYLCEYPHHPSNNFKTEVFAGTKSMYTWFGDFLCSAGNLSSVRRSQDF